MLAGVAGRFATTMGQGWQTLSVVHGLNRDNGDARCG
jgi:hypothetical protein